METGTNEISAREKETGRVEAFSDGVFAIAITLLVLDIKIPRIDALSGGLSTALFENWPSFVAFFVSFSTILIMWINHHNIFNYVKYTDASLLFLNGFLLLTVIFVPFPTSLLAEHFKSAGAGIAAAIYAGAFFLNCLSFNVLWIYASRDKRLLDKNIEPAAIAAIKRNGLIGLPFYLTASIVAFLSVPVSVGICFLLAVYFAVISFISRRN